MNIMSVYTCEHSGVEMPTVTNEDYYNRGFIMGLNEARKLILAEGEFKNFTAHTLAIQIGDQLRDIIDRQVSIRRIEIGGPFRQSEIAPEPFLT